MFSQSLSTKYTSHSISSRTHNTHHDDRLLERGDDLVVEVRGLEHLVDELEVAGPQRQRKGGVGLALLRQAKRATLLEKVLRVIKGLIK